MFLLVIRYIYLLPLTACGLYPWTLSTIPSTGQNKCNGNILLHIASVFTVKMADHFVNCLRHIEKNVPIEFILPSRWQKSAESLGIETTNCPCYY